MWHKSPTCMNWQLVCGDDTQVIGQSYHDVLAVEIGYDATRAVANKSSSLRVRRGRTRFLRIETRDHLRGYPRQAIPLTTQGRPQHV